MCAYASKNNSSNNLPYYPPDSHEITEKNYLTKNYQVT